jgi:very-short-patch-repair endonuclease
VARADFGWPEALLIAEIDGFGPHSSRSVFQRDRTRQNALVNAGWLVLRFTVDDIRLRPEMVVDVIRKALARVR